VAFTSYQLASAIEEVSKQFFVSKDEGKITNQVLDRLFKALLEDVRASKPPGTHFCEIAKLVEKIEGAAFESMGHIPERLAKRLSGKRVLTSIDGTPVQFVFFGPRARDRSVSGTSDDDKRLYLEFQHQALAPALAPTEANRQDLSPGNTLLATLPRQLPPPPRDFAGRDQLIAELLDTIQERAVTMVGLQGLGGTGKTALALILAERLAVQYPAQIYLNLRGDTHEPLTSEDVLTHVIRAYRPEKTISGATAELSGLYYSILNDQPTLLVLDNVADARQIQSIVPPKNCLLILTSRRHFVLSGLHLRKLHPLLPREARQFLTTIAPHSTLEADRIAALCGYLPLALRAAGSALAESPDLSPIHYTSRLADTRRRLELVDPSTQISIQASLTLSFELLPAHCQELLGPLSVFADGFASSAAAAIWRLPREVASESLSTLTRFSLLDYDAATDRYRLHSLVRAFADTRLSDVALRRNVFARHARYFRTVLRRAGSARRNPLQADHQLDIDWQNVLSAHAWATANADHDKLARRLMVTFPRWTFEALTHRLMPQDRMRWLESGTRGLHSHRGHEAMAYNSIELAFVSAQIGEVRRALGALRHLTTFLRDLSNIIILTQTLYALGQIGTASPQLGTLLIEFFSPMALSPGTSYRKTVLLHSLGVLCISIKRHREAIQFLELALEGMRVISEGPERANAIELTLRYLIDSSLAIGASAQAEGYRDRLLEIISARQDSHYSSPGRLALVSARLGDSQRAEQLYEQSRRTASTEPHADAAGEILSEAIGWRNAAKDEAMTKENAEGFIARAIELTRESVRLARVLSDTWTEGRALFELACLQMDSDELSAVEYFREAIPLLRHCGDREVQVRALVLLSMLLVNGNHFESEGFEEGLTVREQAAQLLADLGDPRAEEMRKSVAQWRGFAREGGDHPFLGRHR
jgi:tetratricopeptide (TPR) repeat protein